MQHVMLDLETWGTRPGSALRSIGAVAFHPNGVGAIDTFYRNIDKQSCIDCGLTVDPLTVAWWEQQSREARAALDADQHPLLAVVGAFEAWWESQHARFIWCQGGNFDEPLWTAACAAVACAPPWKYWDTRCTRTIYHAARFDTRTFKRDGPHHNALEDALFQVKCVQESYRRLRPPSAAA
jgi:3'-5' exoribonuclease-like protein